MDFFFNTAKILFIFHLLWCLNMIKNIKTKNQKRFNHSAHFRICVIYQPHEVAGEQLLRIFCIAPLGIASLRSNRGSNRKLRKRQNLINKQM